MGYPRSHYAFHVALYDPILASLSYRLEKLDVEDSEGEKIFPDAERFRCASHAFLIEFSDHYDSAKKRSQVVFRWLKEIFSGCVDPFRFEISRKANPPADSGPVLVTVVEEPNNETMIPRAIIQIRKQLDDSDALLQCAKCFGRYILKLTVRSFCFPYRFPPDSLPVFRADQSSITLIFQRS